MNKPPDNEETARFIDEVNDRIWLTRGNSYHDYDPVKLANEAFEKADAIGYSYGKGRCLLNIGMGAFIIKHDSALAFQQIGEALEIFKALENKKWIANAMLTLGILHNSTGNAEAALYHALRGIDYYEAQPGDDQDKIMAYYIIGTVYKDLKKYGPSEKHYTTGLAIRGFENSIWGGRILAGLSNIYTEQEKYEEAIAMSLKGLAMLKAENNTMGESRVLTDIGIIYKKRKNYTSALAYLSEGLKLREDNDVKQFILTSLVEIAALYSETGETEKALDHLKRAGDIAFELNVLPKLAKIYQEIGDIYKSAKAFEKALGYYEKFMHITIDLTRQETEKKISHLQNALLDEKEEEIERLKNVELKQAYELISEKNKEVTDSINYARRIQECILSSEAELKEALGDHFLFYKPKDIVSGDFYWTTYNHGCFYLAVCDSTGHGVPGAFMSVLNINFLNEAINEKNISEPDKVLDYVRQRLMGNISQYGGKDGMDGTLLCIDQKNNRITYSSAFNSPALVSDGKLVSLPADKMPVGKGENVAPFQLHIIPAREGAMLYLFTDGFADQFGGPKGKKFKYKQLDDLLLSFYEQSLALQSEALSEAFENWKQGLEQVDDVLVIGIRL